MRNGRKGEYLDLPFFCGCGGWAAFLYDRTVPKIGAAFLDSPVRLWIAAYAKTRTCRCSDKQRRNRENGSPPGSLAIFSSLVLYIIRQPCTVSKRAGCGYSHIPCHLNHIGEGIVGRRKAVG